MSKFDKIFEDILNDKYAWKPFIEQVPTEFVYMLRDTGVGNNTGDANGNKWNMDELEDDIRANGFEEPLLITVGVSDEKVRLEQGNHRIQIANKIGLKTVPVVCQIKEHCELVNGHKHSYDFKGKLHNIIKVDVFEKPSNVFTDLKGD